MTTLTIKWLQKCRCGNKTHIVESSRGNPYRLWDDDSVKCNSCGREGIIQVTEGFARVLWETDEEQAERKSMTSTKDHNNHPAHSPLTSRRLHQMSDILSKAAAQRDGVDIGYAMSDAVKLIDEAIAELGAEPVAINDGMAYAFHHALSDSSLGVDEVEEIKTGLRAAFANVTNPPAPVVPEEKQMPNPLKMYAVDAVAAIAEVRGWNDCRAAMLQAGNSPVTPDGWVMVPVEPTDKQWAAGMQAFANGMDKVSRVYKAMLAAAPQKDESATPSNVDNQ